MSHVLAAVSALLLLQAEASFTPIKVQVEVAAKAGPAVEAWAKELRSALAARTAEFRVVKQGEPAELSVKLDSIDPGEGAPSKLVGRIVVGKAERPFTYTFTDVPKDAARLARNLRPLADKMQSEAR